MRLSISDTVSQCRDLLKAGIQPFVDREMQTKFGPEWERQSGHMLSNGKVHFDLQALLRIIIGQYNDVFARSMSPSTRALFFELKDWRNHVAHEHEMTLDDTSRFLDTAARALRAIGAPQGNDIDRLKIPVMQAIIAYAAVAQSPKPLVQAKSMPEPQNTSMVPSTRESPRQVHVLGAPAWAPCMSRISAKLGVSFPNKVGRTTGFTADKTYAVCCILSKKHGADRYWWNLRETQLNTIAAAEYAYVALACGTPEDIILLPIELVSPLLPTFNPKPGDDGAGWHVHVLQDADNWYLLQTGRDNRVNVTGYLI